jgi:hypothetical protein
MSTREEMMKPIDRRGGLRGMLRGAAIAGVSMALIPNATEAVPQAMRAGAVAGVVGGG